MKKIGIFYGPQGGSTERVAEQIAEAFGESNVELVPVEGKTSADISKYDNIVFGLSTIGKETWASENVANDWDLFLPEVEKTDFADKVVAMFGLGDHLRYALHFVDSLGILGQKLIDKNVKIVGHCDPADYEFEESKGIIDGKFIGLPIDEDFEPEMTQKRIEEWVLSIKNDLK